MLLNLIEEPGITAALTSAADKFPRTWDAWQALTWVLARNPTIGFLLNDVPPPPRYLYKQAAMTAGVQTMTVVYSFNNSAITIQLLRLT